MPDTVELRVFNNELRVPDVLAIVVFKEVDVLLIAVFKLFTEVVKLLDRLQIAVPKFCTLLLIIILVSPIQSDPSIPVKDTHAGEGFKGEGIVILRQPLY